MDEMASGEMSRREYRDLIRRELRLTFRAAARVFGWSRRQTTRYATGEVVLPAPDRKLLRLVRDKGIALDEVAER